MTTNKYLTRLPSGKGLSRTASILGLALLVPAAANAATIYTETFTSVGTVAINTLGWSALRNNGTDYSGGPLDEVGNNLITVSGGIATVASSSTQFSTHFALLSDAGSIDPTAYQNDLTVSFTENATDAGTPSPEMGWRVLAQVGTTIYASNLFVFSSSYTTRNVIVSNSIWHVWTNETNVSATGGAFTIGDISGSAGNLPAGLISNFGILAIDGNGNNDRMRLNDFSITGTAIPEPSAALLGGLGLLCLLRRRR